MRARKFDIETGLQFDISLITVIAAAHSLAEALGLALSDSGASLLDIDAEHLLDRLLDIALVGVASDLKDELTLTNGRHRAHLRAERRQQNLQ